MIRSGIVPLDAPSFVHQEVERRRIQIERNMPSMHEEMESFMRQMQARRWIPAKSRLGKRIVGLLRGSPGWLVRFRESLKSFIHSE